MNNFDDILNSTPEQEQNGNQQFSKEEYAAKKRAERDGLFVLSNDTASDVANDGDKFREYMDVQGRFDRYSAVNTLLILAQKPEATRVGDFENWKKKNASVKTGETGISILEPHEYPKEDGSLGVGYNVKKVFDISQVHTQRMKADPVPPTYNNRQLLAALVHNPPVTITPVEVLAGGAGAQTDPGTGEIKVRKGMEFADAFRSVAKELAASQLTPSQEARFDTEFASYCVSYLLCKKHGVDTKTFDFKDAPNELKHLETKEIKAIFQAIRDTFADISGKMNKQLEVLQKPARNVEAR